MECFLFIMHNQHLESRLLNIWTIPLSIELLAEDDLMSTNASNTSYTRPPLSSKGDDGFMVSGQQELLQKLQQSNHTEKIFKFIRLFAKSYK